MKFPFWPVPNMTSNPWNQFQKLRRMQITEGEHPNQAHLDARRADYERIVTKYPRGYHKPGSYQR